MRTDQPAQVWAGVDVGTQSLRVVLVDDTGRVAGHGAGSLTSHRAGAVHEQDPAQWWAVLGSAFRQALKDVDPRAVLGVAICGTSGTFLLADAVAGTPLTPALMYDDARASAEAPDVTAALGHATQPSWALPKLVHLLRTGPAPLRAGLESGHVRMVHCPDHLAERLVGGPVATDWSHALKTGYDLDELDWPTGALGRLGLSPAVLPAVVRPGTPLGTVSASGADHTGLPVGTPVLAGMSDGCAAQIAAGALAPGSWNSVLGTTLVLKGVTATRIVDPANVIYSHRHPDGGWLPGGASSVGAGILERRFPSGDRDALDRAAARYEPSGGIAYPLAGRGERFPFFAPDAEGFELGTPVDEADRYAAVLQGVAFVERLAYSTLRHLGADVDGPLSATGGAVRSRYWTQLRADILGRPIRLPASPEPAFGMAVLAAAGKDGLHATSRHFVRIAETVDPRPGSAERFADAYGGFVDELADRGHLEPDLARYAKEQP